MIHGPHDTSPKHNFKIGDDAEFWWNDGSAIKPRWTIYPGKVIDWDHAEYDMGCPDLGGPVKVPHEQIIGKQKA